MTTHQNHAADRDRDREDVLALLDVLETVSELADLVHRHRLACARLRQELAELADGLLLREAQAAVQAEGKNAEERRARQALWLSGDADYQRLKQRERDVRREIAEREADIERAHVRIRITLAALPLAQAVDALSVEAAETEQERTPERTSAGQNQSQNQNQNQEEEAPLDPIDPNPPPWAE